MFSVFQPRQLLQYKFETVNMLTLRRDFYDVYKIIELLNWMLIGLVFMGNVLEAFLVSDIDGFCVECYAFCSKRKEQSQAFVAPCVGEQDPQNTQPLRFQDFSIDNRTGLLREKIVGFHLTSRDNSDNEQAEIVTGRELYTRGNLWKFENGNVINRFGFCLEREIPKGKERSGLIQAKCNPQNNWQKFHFA